MSLSVITLPQSYVLARVSLHVLRWFVYILRSILLGLSGLEEIIKSKSGDDFTTTAPLLIHAMLHSLFITLSHDEPRAKYFPTYIPTKSVP